MDFNYKDEIIGVLTKEEFIASLLYAEGYDAKNKVATGAIDTLPVIVPSHGASFIDDFYSKEDVRPDALVIDLGGNKYLPTYFRSWKVVKYLELDGSPYLGLQGPYNHFAYFVGGEPINHPMIPDSKAISYEKAEGYGDWGDYMGMYDSEPDDTLDHD